MNPDFYKIFPTRLREAICSVKGDEEKWTELRFRVGSPVMLLYGKEEKLLSRSQGFAMDKKSAYMMTQNEIKEMMEYISNYSFYAYEEEIRQGFLTIQGGHRIGFCGKTVLAEGGIRTIRNISFLNIRLAHQIKGCAKEVLPLLLEGDRLCHTLIISPPSCGKTTLLRDIIRLLSDGTEGKMGIRGRKVGVVDERSEIAACYHGVPQNEIGIRTDVLDCCPKDIGMQLLLRAMSPEVIAVDELGTKEDIAMAVKAVRSGCSILATAHGDGFAEWKAGGGIRNLCPEHVFERYVFLSAKQKPGEVEMICDSNYKEVVR